MVVWQQAAVRKTLGYSLHELAQVLGEEVTKEHLLPAFQAFMADIDEVPSQHPTPQHHDRRTCVLAG